jgi:hypothetical protein
MSCGSKLYPSALEEISGPGSCLQPTSAIHNRQQKLGASGDKELMEASEVRRLWVRKETRTMNNNNPNNTVFTHNQDEDEEYNYEDDRHDALTGDNKLACMSLSD